MGAELPLNYSLSPTLPELLGDNYNVIGRIGEGGYGWVYKIKNFEGKELAVKRVDHKEEIGLRWLLEPILMRSVRHPHLNQAVEVLSFPTTTLMVMDLAVSDLQTHLHTYSDTTSLTQLGQWIWQVAQGVACLHELDV